MQFKPKGPSFKTNLDQLKVPPIKINDFEIKEVDNTKFLGVTIGMRWNGIPSQTLILLTLDPNSIKVMASLSTRDVLKYLLLVYHAVL